MAKILKEEIRKVVKIFLYIHYLISYLLTFGCKFNTLSLSFSLSKNYGWDSLIIIFHLSHHSFPVCLSNQKKTLLCFFLFLPSFSRATFYLFFFLFFFLRFGVEEISSIGLSSILQFQDDDNNVDDKEEKEKVREPNDCLLSAFHRHSLSSGN